MSTLDATRLGIGVIGAGRVGAVLASVLRSQGHGITGVTARAEASRERAELMLPGVPVLAEDLLVERSEVVLLGVPDDALGEVCERLAPRVQVGQIVVHVSGRHGTDVLAPVAARGAICLALHPAMTFTGTSLDIPRLAGCPFAITAKAAVLPIAQALVVELGGEPVVVAEADRPLYHAALAHGANHLTVVVAQARAVLERLGVDEPGSMLGPLLRAALEESLTRGTDGLTGPVVRGDVATVRDHLTALAELAADLPAGDHDGTPTDVEALLDVYRACARAAARGRLDPARRARLLAVLDGTADPHDQPHDEPQDQPDDDREPRNAPRDDSQEDA